MTIDCAIVGDSIAVGISHYRRDCYVDARVSRRASQQPNLTVSARVVVISLGSNSPTHLAELHRIRDSARPAAVIWVLPNSPERARELVLATADHYGDLTVDVRPTVSVDGVHPTANGYRQLATETRTLGRLAPR